MDVEDSLNHITSQCVGHVEILMPIFCVVVLIPITNKASVGIEIIVAATLEITRSGVVLPTWWRTLT